MDCIRETKSREAGRGRTLRVEVGLEEREKREEREGEKVETLKFESLEIRGGREKEEGREAKKPLTRVLASWFFAPTRIVSADNAVPAENNGRPENARMRKEESRGFLLRTGSRVGSRKLRRGISKDADCFSPEGDPSVVTFRPLG